ncbi:hypothetical protein DFJ58DRAFT_842267 [Suillus subalutaceus]|uniref:uncharacterized protein n=1 Tax=Suillus subalutaceus TaxID=48586 RepID=UPI001B875814|nr:uncharacterized protein DFJ58DRAFT_842267 [Suillus subalutaceus]KAG1851072.1 hypothetical protein DFJ58DRAFT_842267 [Suillus subalutaceus]
MSLQPLSSDRTIVHAHHPPPYEIYHIFSPDHPFLPGAPVTKRIFKDLHQGVFGELLIRGFNLNPIILNAEASHHFHSVVLRNNCNVQQQESPVVFSLQYKMGICGPMRLFSLWKKCCFSFLVQSNLLDPVTHTFSAVISDRVTLARHDDNKYKWLHTHDSHMKLPPSGPYGRIPRKLLYQRNLTRNYHLSLHTSADLRTRAEKPQLQDAFGAEWDWDIIERFDGCYSSNLVNNEETTRFFDDMTSMMSQLIASWDHIAPQIRDSIILVM